jgi:hypothetical protein
MTMETTMAIEREVTHTGGYAPESPTEGKTYLISGKTVGWTMVAAMVIGAVLAIILGWLPGTLVPDTKPFDPTSKSVETIYHDTGGVIDGYIERYGKIADMGGQVRVAGMCVSACTYVLGLVPAKDVCATPAALFGFHGTYSASTNEFDPVFTQFMHKRIYPQRVLDALLSKGFDGTTDVDEGKYPYDVIWLNRDEVGVQPCP